MFRSALRFARPVSARSYSQVAGKPRPSMKQLVRDYGWTAAGVYLLLSAVDLPLTFLFVHSIGQDRLEDAEIAVRKRVGVDYARENTLIHRAASGGRGLLWTELGIAYIIHKSLLVFVRVPLTVAITPAVTRKLADWGFKVKRVVPTVDRPVLASNIERVGAKTGSKTARTVAEKAAKNVRGD